VGTWRGSNSAHGRARAFSFEAEAKKIKREGVNMAAVYKVGKKWRADTRDLNGQRLRFRTKAEADEHVTRIKSEIASGTYVLPKDISTFGALADAWIAGRIEQSRTPGAGYRPSTLAQWQSHIAHMKTCFDEVKVNDISAQQVELAMGKWRLPKDQDGRGLSVRTVGKVLTTMSRIFKFGIRNRCGIQVDPTKLIERVKENSGEQSETGERLYTGLHQVTETEVLTPEEVKRVILAAKPGLYRTIIQTAIYTGARISEILALRWEDLNLDRGVIQIRRSLSIARVKGEANQEKIRWFDPKTKSGSREIPIPSELVAALRAWKEKCPNSRLDLVFCNPFGEPCDRTGIGRSGLNPALKQAQIGKAVTLHGLRHTYASMLILLGRRIPEVSRYLGHADVSVTMKVYTHFLETKKHDTMSDLERLIQNG
jgi:integrase